MDSVHLHLPLSRPSIVPIFTGAARPVGSPESPGSE